MSRGLLTIALLLINVLAGLPAHGDDWSVKRPPGEMEYYVNTRKYGAIKDQKAWDDAFAKAFERGDASAVEYLVKLRRKSGLTFDLNARDEKTGRTLLHKAVSQRTGAMATALIRLGADVNAEDEQGDTPLHAAVAAHAQPSIELLTRNKDVDIDAANKRGEHALGMALLAHNISAVRTLMARKPSRDFKINGSPLEDWIFLNDSVVGFEALYPKINARHLPREKGTGITPLHRAAANNATKIVGRLLALGANPNVTNDLGQPAFAFAITNGHSQAFEVFLRKSPRIINYREPRTGATPLHIALETGNFDFAETILKHKPRVDLFDSQMRTPLDLLNKQKRLAPSFDAELRKKLTAIEKRLGKSPGPFYEQLKKAVVKNDAAALRELAAGIPDEELDQYIVFLIERKKTSLLVSLLKEKKNYLLEHNINIFEQPLLYRPGYWPVFAAVYEEFNGVGFGACQSSTCGLEDVVIRADSVYLDRIPLLVPAPDLGRTSSGQSVFLDTISKRIEELHQSQEQTTDSVYQRDFKKEISRLEKARTALRKAGYMTEKEQLDFPEVINKAIREGHGVELFRKHVSKGFLATFGPLMLTKAVLYDDTKLAEALLAKMGMAPPDQELRWVYPMASAKMESLLRKAGFKPPHPIACSPLFSEFVDYEDAPRLKQWVESSHLGNCADAAELLENYSARNNPISIGLLLAFLKTEKARKVINTPRALGASLLHHFAKLCDPAVLQAALDAGADPRVLDAEQRTPLHYLVTYGKCADSNSKDAIGALTNAGVDVNAKNSGEDLTALGAIFSNDWQMPEADPQKKDETALALLEAGADPHTLLESRHDNFPHSFIEEAASSSRKSLLQWLNARDIAPDTPRSCPAPTGGTIVVRNDELTIARLNGMLAAHRERRREAQRSESCENIKDRANAEFLKAISQLGQLLGGLKKASTKLWQERDAFYWPARASAAFAAAGLALDESFGDNAQSSLCCGYGPLADDRCRRQRSCVEKADARETAELFCERFAGESDVSSLGFVMTEEYTSREPLPLYRRFKIAPTRVVTIAIADASGKAKLAISVPVGFTAPSGTKPEKLVEQIVERQFPAVYAALHLESLASYIGWKYPQCAALNQTDGKARKQVGVPRSGSKNTGASGHSAVRPD